MTSEHEVELVRQGFVAWETGDVETAISYYDPEIVVYAPPEIGNSGTFSGLEGFVAWSGAWFEAWETFSQELGPIESCGERHILARTTQTGVGKGSGIEVVRDATYVYEIQDDKLIYMSLFFVHENALAHVREREGSD